MFKSSVFVVVCVPLGPVRLYPLRVYTAMLLQEVLIPLGVPGGGLGKITNNGPT